MRSLFHNKYFLVVNAISIMVALLIHSPEMMDLSNLSGEAALSPTVVEQRRLFPGIIWADVLNEIAFTYLSLLFLFYLNERLFRFNDGEAEVGWGKLAGSFALTWLVNSLLGKGYVFLHQMTDLPAIDAMLHHYLHPLRDFLVSCVVTGTGYLSHLNRKSQRVTIENQQLRTENVVNQYEALKSQLNPHMLFNSLNTLYALIRESPDKARSYLSELSKVLRYTLQDNGSHAVALRDEMAFVQSFIYLLKMRYEENLMFDIQVAPEALGHKLPPMAIQMLLENAVKHNEISDRHPLTIHITADERQVTVSNHRQPKRNSDAGIGIGLSNLAKRYRLLFRKEIEIREENDCFTIILPLI